MKLLTENTLPPLIVTLAFSLCLLVISSGARAVESSALVGFYVTHTSKNYSQDKNVGDFECRDTNFSDKANTNKPATKKAATKKTATKKPVAKKVSKKANAKKAA